MDIFKFFMVCFLGECMFERQSHGQSIKNRNF